jgi:hypothetical protein
LLTFVSRRRCRSDARDRLAAAGRDLPSHINLAPPSPAGFFRVRRRHGRPLARRMPAAFAEARALGIQGIGNRFGGDRKSLARRRRQAFPHARLDRSCNNCGIPPASRQAPLTVHKGSGAFFDLFRSRSVTSPGPSSARPWPRYARSTVLTVCLRPACSQHAADRGH